MNAPGWQPDPTARHEYRYWDGSQWTDDVSDGGVTATDPVDGSGAAASPGGGDPDATQAIDPATQVFQGGPVPPGDQGYPSGQQAPGAPSPGAAPSGPGYGGYDSGPYSNQGYGAGGYSGGGMPPGQPAKKGMSGALIAVIALIAVLAIGGAAFALTSGGGDDDDQASGTTTTTAGDTTTTADDSTDDTSGDSTDDTSGDTSDTTLPDELDDSLDDSLDDADSGDPSAVVGLLAEGVQQGAPDLTDEQAECIAQAMVDELGEEEIFSMASESGDPFASLTPEQQAALTSQMLECAPADAFIPDTGA